MFAQGGQCGSCRTRALHRHSAGSFSPAERVGPLAGSRAPSRRAATEGKGSTEPPCPRVRNEKAAAFPRPTQGGTRPRPPRQPRCTLVPVLAGALQSSASPWDSGHGSPGPRAQLQPGHGAARGEGLSVASGFPVPPRASEQTLDNRQAGSRFTSTPPAGNDGTAPLVAHTPVTPSDFSPARLALSTSTWVGHGNPDATFPSRPPLPIPCQARPCCGWKHLRDTHEIHANA